MSADQHAGERNVGAAAAMPVYAGVEGQEQAVSQAVGPTSAVPGHGTLGMETTAGDVAKAASAASIFADYGKPLAVDSAFDALQDLTSGLPVAGRSPLDLSPLSFDSPFRPLDSALAASNHHSPSERSIESEMDRVLRTYDPVAEWTFADEYSPSRQLPGLRRPTGKCGAKGAARDSGEPLQHRLMGSVLQRYF